MSKQELIGLLESHQDDIQQLLSEAHKEMASAVAGGFSDSTDHRLIFEGLRACINEQGEFEVNVGGWSWEAIPRGARLLELEKTVQEEIAKVIAFKEEMEDIISHAGDIKCSELECLQNLVEAMVRYQENRGDSARVARKFGDLGQLALDNGFSLSASSIEDSFIEAEGKIVKSLGSFSMAMTKSSEEEIAAKINIEFYRNLLALYQKQYVNKKSGKTLMKFALQDNPKGIPMVFRNDEYVKWGFYQMKEGISIIEDMRVEFSNGCSFQGRSVDGHLVGKGSLRMLNGNLFTGTVFDDERAEGEMQDGDELEKGTYSLRIEGDTRWFTLTGRMQKFKKGKLIMEGVVNNDKTFEGWIINGTSKMTGKWNNSGTFVRGKVEKDDYSIEGTFCERGAEGRCKQRSGNYFFEGEFKNGEKHGKGRSTNNGQTIVGEWSRGKLISGVATDGNWRYEGEFNDNSFHGRGKLQQPELFYEGEFRNGKFHGKGTCRDGTWEISGTFYEGKPHGECTQRSAKNTYIGTFFHGKRQGRGKLIGEGFTYIGDFSDGQMHGKGEYSTGKWTYTGYLARGEFEGQGKWVQNDFTYEGGFRNNKFNGYGTMKLSSGESRSGVFRDDQLV